MPHRAVPEKHKAFARSMRAEATKSESILWQALRGKKLEGLKFKRQVPIEGYIVDFICFEEKLIVEVDGGQHSESKRDEKRDTHLRSHGFQIVRFWNDDVTRNIDGICAEILKIVDRE